MMFHAELAFLGSTVTEGLDLPAGRLIEVSRGFRGWNDTIWLSGLCVLAGAALLTWVFIKRRRTNRESGAYAARTFGRLLGLSRTEYYQLKKLARAARLSTPIPLLVSEGCFDSASRAAEHGCDSAMLIAIRQRVFQT